jgi:hypothetical protein
MFFLLLQIALTIVSGYLLGLLARKAIAASPATSLIVATGFLVRIVVGQALFWISYLRLPIARGLQLGEGFWFIGLDARYFYDQALKAMSHGPMAVLLIDRTQPAFTYVQLLAILMSALGTTSSIGILINAFAYLFGAYMLVRWSRRSDGSVTTAGRVALLAFSFTPSWILWAVQPMKDALMMTLAIAFFYAVFRLEQASSGRPADYLRRGAIAGLILFSSLYVIAGIRWYYAVWAWSFGALALTILLIFARPFRRDRLVMVCTIVLLSTRFLVLGCGPFMPESMQRLFNLRTALGSITQSTRWVTQGIEGSRRTQELVTGNTTLVAGEQLKHATGERDVPMSAVAGHRPSPSSRSARGAPVSVPATSGVSTSAGATPSQGAQPRMAEAPVAASGAGTAAGSQRADGPAVAGEDQKILMPKSRAARVLVGLSALVLPRFVATRLGLLHVEGGRGLWLFAEVDTIVFDLVLLIAIAFVIRAHRKPNDVTPLLWPLVLMTFTLGLAIAYVSTNFGTLFRHRGMVFLGLFLIPLAVSAAGSLRALRSARASATEETALATPDAMP